MVECHYLQEQEPFQDRLLGQIALALMCWRSKREIACLRQLMLA